MAGTINKKELQNIIFNNKQVNSEILQIAKNLVEKEKNILIKKFNDHPVTQEIESGENASNISGTLGGYGNLFSFIGFLKGSNPIGPIKNLLNQIKLNEKSTRKENIFSFKIQIPSKDDIASVSKMPWESGRSWLWDVEKSISGLGAYLFGKFKQSRSETAIESKYNFRNKIFVKVSYFTPMYNNFIKQLQGKIK